MLETSCVLADGSELSCQVRFNRRAKRLILRVYGDGRVVVTVPRPVNLPQVKRLLRQRRAWITERLHQAQRRQPLITNTRANYLRYKEQARSLVLDRLRHYNTLYRFTIGRVAIRNQQTRWGSCSARANLNFNYRLVFLPGALVDYVIVHELCHVRVLNHSPLFWQLVAQTLPDYQERCRKLRDFPLY